MPEMRKRMIQGLDGVADFQLLRRSHVVVDQHVVGALERSAREVVERSTHGLERLEVDAINHFQIAAGGKLGDDRSDGHDVIEFAQLVGHLDGNWSAADAHEQRRARRLHHDVGADADLAVLGVVEHADGKADDQQNQGDFNRDRDHADEGAEGTVHQVGKDHLVHDSLLIV